MTIRTLLVQAQHQLSHLEDAPLIARTLLAHAIQQPHTYLHSHPELAIDPQHQYTFQNYLQRAANEEPLAYIVGYREFYNRRFTVTPDTLIPRPASEQLIEIAVQHLQKQLAANSNLKPLIVDVGTGSGCLGITLALEIPQSHVYAIDISPAALKVARSNASQLQATNITFLHGNLLEPLASQSTNNSYHAIIANLPYISNNEYINLPKNIRNFEPTIALISGDTPDAINNLLIKQAKPYLHSQGLLAYETTNGQIVLADLKG